MEWGDHATRWWWGKYINIGIWCGKLKERDHFGHLSSYGRIPLKWILKIGAGRARIGLLGLWSRIGGCLL
jgi:hypothetical protein